MNKKKIVILGSTGSIGKSLLKIISREKNNFNIVLLTANKNYKQLLIQAKKFKVKNVILTNKKSYQTSKHLFIKNRIKIFNDFKKLGKILEKRVDYAMSSIIGLDGLYPTLKIIKYTKQLAIANKEALICGWQIIKKNLIKNKTNFVPVDSEHFSIWKSLNKKSTAEIKEIIITASGGPFLNTSSKKMEKIKVADALKHPNWSMGKKISIDSSTMMNKVFEIIEAKNIFELPYEKLKILIHPSSYVHAIILYNDGLINLVAHETTMQIPIFNSLFPNNEKKYISKNINLKILNNLCLQPPDYKKYPLLKILRKIPKKQTLYNTVIVAANDEYVKLFLRNKITYNDISKKITKFISLKEFKKFKKSFSFTVEDILKLDKYVRFKINTSSI